MEIKQVLLGRQDEVYNEYGTVIVGLGMVAAKDLLINNKPYSRGIELSRLRKVRNSIQKNGYNLSEVLVIREDGLVNCLICGRDFKLVRLISKERRTAMIAASRANDASTLPRVRLPGQPRS